MQTTSHPYRLAALIAVAAVGLASPTAAFASYGWPVKPFQQQHAIRSYFGDPRIGVNKCVHFGIDISAPDGTPVYATISGVIRMHPLHPTEAVMVTNGSTTYEYWHLRPAFTSGHAVAYRTVLGWIMSGYQHVHFSERHGSTYVNPLRPDGLQPYLDTTRPSVGDIDVSRDGGGFDLSAEAHDTAPLAVPAPWDDRPLTPALVQWRIQRVGGGTPGVEDGGRLPGRPAERLLRDLHAADTAEHDRQGRHVSLRAPPLLAGGERHVPLRGAGGRHRRQRRTTLDDPRRRC